MAADTNAAQRDFGDADNVRDAYNSGDADNFGDARGSGGSGDVTPARRGGPGAGRPTIDVAMPVDVIEVLAARLTEPTSRSLAEAVTRAIRDGVVGDGARLPAIRTVARELQLSPTTVSAAWSLLSRAGTIHTDGRRGTTVSGRDKGAPTRYRRALETRTDFALDLATGVGDPALLPRLPLDRLRSPAAPSSYLDDPVLPDLAEVIRSEWPYSAERLTVVDGAMDALDQVCASALRFGDPVAVEHPGFPPLLDLLDALGMRTVGMRLDAEGVVPADLRQALSSGVTAVILQPRAQNPTGVSMTVARASELADVLADHDALVIEDDSAGAIAGAHAISLGRWLPARTVHIRSYSKSHGPDLRLAAVSGPAAVLDRVTERRLLGQGWSSRLLQSLLLELLTAPEPVAQVDAARAEYRRRRTAVVSALADRGLVLPEPDGINLWVPVRDETAALVRLASRGIGAAAGSPFAAGHELAPHLRVTVGLVSHGHAELAQELVEASTTGGWAGPR